MHTDVVIETVHILMKLTMPQSKSGGAFSLEPLICSRCSLQILVDNDVQCHNFDPTPTLDIISYFGDKKQV